MRRSTDAPARLPDRRGELTTSRARRNRRRAWLIQFSSGSTTDLKPVALTHAQLAQLAALRSLLVEQPGTHEKGVSWLPSTTTWD
jgi:acyl-CoA synthetase (AMP-forming)/AMP-acid ligase II